MRSFYTLLLPFLLCIVHRAAAQGSNSITVPPGGFDVKAGEDVTIEWTDPSTSTVTVQLVPASGAGNGVTLGSTLPNNGLATLSVPADISPTQPYRFKIIDDSNSSNSKTSSSFTISPPAPGRVTSTRASSGATASANSDASSSSESALSSKDIAGMSAGVIIGTCFLIGIVVFFIWRRRKHTRGTEQKQQQQLQQYVGQQEEVQYQSHTMELYNSRTPPYDTLGSYNARLQSKPSEPSEVPGNKTFPREMEGMSRFQQAEIAELAADDVESGTETRRARGEGGAG